MELYQSGEHRSPSMVTSGPRLSAGPSTRQISSRNWHCLHRLEGRLDGGIRLGAVSRMYACKTLQGTDRISPGIEFISLEGEDAEYADWPHGWIFRCTHISDCLDSSLLPPYSL